MHRSRLSTLVIDCAEAEYQRSVEFWSGALGKRVVPDEDPRYASLRGRVGGEGGPYVLLQRVPVEERAVHLDIETDDVAAEVARLEELALAIRERASSFCVVRVEHDEIDALNIL